MRILFYPLAGDYSQLTDFDMLRVASGWWCGVDGWTADALRPDLDSPKTLVLAFGAAKVAETGNALQELREAYPSSQIVGCSTSGEILGDVFRDNSVAVAVARFESTEIRTAHAAADDGQSASEVGRSLARQLEPDGLRAVFVLSNGHNVNGSDLVRGMNDVLPEGTIVTGGLAGDGERFEKTWVLQDGKPVSDAVSAVGFYGEDVAINHGCEGGWDKFGVERLVTRSSGNVLYELDGIPALDLYKKYLGDQARELPAAALLFPLAVRENAVSTEQVVRTVLNIDDARKAMIFAGDVPEGSLAQFMMSNTNKLVESAGQAANVARPAESPDVPTLAIAVSCVGRRLVLGSRAEDELEASLEMLPPGAVQIGFYSYGELAPGQSGACMLHNQTMALTTIAES